MQPWREARSGRRAVERRQRRRRRRHPGRRRYSRVTGHPPGLVLVYITHQLLHLIQRVVQHQNIVLRQQQRGDLGQLPDGGPVGVGHHLAETVQGGVQIVHAASLPGVDLEPQLLYLRLVPRLLQGEHVPTPHLPPAGRPRAAGRGAAVRRRAPTVVQLRRTVQRRHVYLIHRVRRHHE